MTPRETVKVYKDRIKEWKKTLKDLPKIIAQDEVTLKEAEEAVAKGFEDKWPGKND